ncbi:uncharacterized protein [Diadema antillarum]|uniref:uncharacterized protein n=1 Tax=Diadema antillarum TaxID=105358 RepID=UPI003A836837
MDVKDVLKIEIIDPDEVPSEVSLLPATPGMDMGVSDVHHVGVSSEAEDEESQACLVVLPVEDVAAGDGVIGKSLELGETPTSSSTGGGPGLMDVTEDDHTHDASLPYDPVTQSWFTTKYSKDSLSEQGHKWKQGMWSRDEIDLLERNIEDYLRVHKLSDPTEVIFNNSKDNRKNFYRSIAQGLQRPLFAVYRRVIRMYDHRNHVGRYSAEDIKKLKELRARHGNDWALIGSELGRSASSVKDKFRLLKDSCNRGKWLLQEENLLTDAVFTLSGAQPGESVTTGISWSQVADRVGTRTEKQCRAKWLNYLNWKQTGGAEWSLVDDITLINRIGESEANAESELDWDRLAKNWKSVRSPQWLRSKWWSLKRQVSGYELLPLKALLEHLKLMQTRKQEREERCLAPADPKPSTLDLSQASQLKNGASTVMVQVPIQIGNASGNLDSSEHSGLQSLMLPQSALAGLSTAGTYLTGQGITTVHEDNHIIIQVTTVQGPEGDSSGGDGSTKQIIITRRDLSQTEPSLGHDETDMCAGIQQAATELSGETASNVHSSDDLQGTTDHMTPEIGQSQVNVVEEHPIGRQAQLIGTDAVLPQQNVSSADMVGGAEAETTLVVVNTAPSSDELSQPTSGTVEDAHLGGGVFTLSGPLPVLQSQGEEHNLMGSPSQLETLQHHHHHHHDEEEVAEENQSLQHPEHREEEEEEEEKEKQVEDEGESRDTKPQRAGTRKRRRARHR